MLVFLDRDRLTNNEIWGDNLYPPLQILGGTRPPLHPVIYVHGCSCFYQYDVSYPTTSQTCCQSLYTNYLVIYCIGLYVAH